MGILIEVTWVIASFLPFFLFAVIFIHSITKKTSRGFFVITNLAIQQIVCLLLKKYFQQARPVGACSSSFGFPSSHSGFTASMTTWLILEAVVFHEKVPFKTSKFYAMMRNGWIAFAPIIPVSRYFLNYHSIEQIVSGFIVGFLCTIIYFGIAMGSFLRNDYGKYYVSIVVKRWKKYNFEDNLVNYQIQEKPKVKKGDKKRKQKKISEESLIVHPFKEQIRLYLEAKLRKEAIIQAKVKKDI
jgi:membrane-associated phospholipid phosphatase